MNTFEQKRFDELYRKHLRALQLHGMSDKTINAYSRAMWRILAWFDGCLDRLVRVLLLIFASSKCCLAESNGFIQARML